MARLDPDDLLLVLVIAEEGNLTRAAEQLHTSQPVISRSLRRIERLAGGPVFERHRRGVTPTPLGRALLGHARTIRTASEHAEHDLTDAIASMERPWLRVGIAPKVSLLDAVAAVAAARAEPGRPRVELEVGPQAALLEALDRGAVDLVIGTVPPPSVHRAVEAIFEDRPLVACRADHPLTRKRRVSLADLHAAGWILPPASDPVRLRLDALFVDAGREPPEPEVVTDDVLLAAALAAQSDLLAVLPGDATAPPIGLGPLQRLAVTFPGRNDEIGVIRRRHEALSPAAQIFVDAFHAAHRDDVRGTRRTR